MRAGWGGKSRLNKYRPEIVALLKNGSPKTFVAQRYGVDPATLYNFIEKHHLDVTPGPLLEQP
jgi:transposase-like protein